MEFFSQTLILFIFLTCFTIPKLGDLLPFYCILFFNYLRYVLKKSPIRFRYALARFLSHKTSALLPSCGIQRQS